ncbi:hypothetical protein FH972_022611 [Carpinus fangiana]|uniref:Thioredoxin domain-containing protein n=1 Tax=Carpinus fangiana TaxID=176857 RepID=A0A5N6KSR6_9ROSI|nr:hypothetical protein FH972_022611 [Carpinus fangiana]
MDIIPVGETSLPMEVILDYLDSLKQIYTAEAYDLFAHNCNNFTNDFSMFLVGKGIPDHITSLPKQVLDTPFGQMLRPQIDSAMRSVTQAPVPDQSTALPSSNGAPKPVTTNGAATRSVGKVHNITSPSKLNTLLVSAQSSCAVIFFTSSTCAPCKLVYPSYDALAEEAGPRCTLIKIDIGANADAQSIASTYSIRATPTFITFLRGKKDDQWSGANPSQLEGNVRLLIQTAFPPHSHDTLKILNFLSASTSPTVYSKVPPLDKLLAKLGPTSSKHPAVNAAAAFIKQRSTDGAREAPVPDLPALAQFLRTAVSSLPPDTLFAAYDLFRLTLADPRVSAFFAEEQGDTTLLVLLHHVNEKGSTCPYNLRLVTIHLACNLFGSRVLRHSILGDQKLAEAIVALAAGSLLDHEHANLRVAAATLALNLANAEHLARRDDAPHGAKPGHLPESVVTEMAASLVEALGEEGESKEAIKGMVLALGRLVYRADKGSEVLDLCEAMDAGAVVLTKKSIVDARDQSMVEEVGGQLLSKGLKV